MTRYRTIVADPPWAYPDGFASNPDRPHSQDREKGVERQAFVRTPLPYEPLTTDAIMALPVGRLMARHCRLFLWTTNRYLPTAFEVMEGWGFRYAQTLVWDKRPNVNPLTGSVAPNAAEFLLVGTRGQPKRLDKWPASVITARKARTHHSAKPDVFLDLVEHVSEGPYLEMFARRQRLGWDTWGDEALPHVDLGVADEAPPEVVNERRKGAA